MSNLIVEVVSSIRIYRKRANNGCSASEPICTRLSIVDAAYGNFTPAGALWFIQPTDSEKSFDTKLLTQSLSITLDAFPQLEGRLRRVHYDAENPDGHDKHVFNHLDICYNDSRAPGVQFDMAKGEFVLDDLVPTAESQAETAVWLATKMPRENTLLQGKLAGAMTSPSEQQESEDGCIIEPTVVIQVTSLLDGAVVIGVKISHPLADAHALALFVREWSTQHTALVRQLDIPPVLGEYPFNPSLLDKVGLDLARNTNEAAVLEKAHTAPMHRFDWWDNTDAPFQWPAMQPPDILKDNPESKKPVTRGQKMNWSEWDQSAGVGHAIIRFSNSQIQTLRRLTNARSFSTLNLIMAHIWSAINRARGFTPSQSPDQGEVFADISIGLRNRLSPPLSANSIGSSLVNIAVPTPSHQACTLADISSLAGKIRSTIGSATPDVLAAHIYGLMRETTPQRVWQCFLGRRHTLITSWVHTGVFDVDFGTGRPPRFVHPIMPMIDGCVQIIEGTPVARGAVADAAAAQSWYAHGVNVNVYLENGAMARLLEDPDLHPR